MIKNNQIYDQILGGHLIEMSPKSGKIWLNKMTKEFNFKKIIRKLKVKMKIKNRLIKSLQEVDVSIKN